MHSEDGNASCWAGCRCCCNFHDISRLNSRKTKKSHSSHGMRKRQFCLVKKKTKSSTGNIEYFPLMWRGVNLLCSYWEALILENFNFLRNKCLVCLLRNGFSSYHWRTLIAFKQNTTAVLFHQKKAVFFYITMTDYFAEAQVVAPNLRKGSLESSSSILLFKDDSLVCVCW